MCNKARYFAVGTAGKEGDGMVSGREQTRKRAIGWVLGAITAILQTARPPDS